MVLLKDVWVVLVTSGCYNKVPQTGWLINNRIYFSQSGGGKSRIKAPADVMYGEGLLPGLEMAFLLLYPHMVERGRELSGFSFIRALSPFLKNPPHGLITSPISTPPLDTIRAQGLVCLFCFLLAVLRLQGLFSSCSARTSHCGGFSCCEARAIGCIGSVVVAQAQLLHSMWDLLHWQADSYPLYHQGSSLEVRF